MYLEQKVDALLEKQNELHAELKVIRGLLESTAVKPPLPYSNFENSKYTFPDATEKPALQVMQESSPFITFNEDGSITFDVPEGTFGKPTVNAKNLRMERREYENMAQKKSYADPSKIAPRDFLVKFDVLPDGLDVTFTQAHGEDSEAGKGTPWFKFVAGKKGIRLQAKTKFGLSEDDVVLDFIPKDKFELGRWYRIQWKFIGKVLYAGVDGYPQTVSFDRDDLVYPKEGGYGPLPFKLTHKAVA